MPEPGRVAHRPEEPRGVVAKRRRMQHPDQAGRQVGAPAERVEHLAEARPGERRRQGVHREVAPCRGRPRSRPARRSGAPPGAGSARAGWRRRRCARPGPRTTAVPKARWTVTRAPPSASARRPASRDRVALDRHVGVAAGGAAQQVAHRPADGEHRRTVRRPLRPPPRRRPADRRGRPSERRAGSRSRPDYARAIASISTSAPAGSAATCTVERAGGCSGKYVA